MERSAIKNGMVNLFTLLLAGVAAFAAAQQSNTLAGQVGVVFAGLGFLAALVSWFQMRMEERERIEQLEYEEVTRGKAGSALFETKDSEGFPARRAREQFERYFVPGFTVLLCLAQVAGAFLFWRWLRLPTTAGELRQPMLALAIFALIALVLFLVGKFAATMARLQDMRLLRPVAGYVLLNAYIAFLVALAVVGVQAGFLEADRYLAYGLAALLGLIAAENLLNVVLEIYRPRIKGKPGRPLYESRLVGLLGQPEGLVTTAAQALDYQFGFKVSETWFYRFFERAVVWLVLLQAGVLLLSTSVVFIDSGEQGVLERFGKPVPGRTLLDAGAHLKLPWPFEKVLRFRTEQVQIFNVGFTPDEDKHEEPVVLWTVAHTKEENFIVANRDPGSVASTNAAGGKRTPPVSLLVVSIPVQYQVKDLLAWAYTHEDAPALLQDVATREVVRYLAAVDMAEIMGKGRLAASELLLQRIQAASDSMKLGAQIISVGLQDLHPPVKVAPDYQKVVSAHHTRMAKVLAAKAEAIRTNELAAAQSATLVNRAEAERWARQVDAMSRASLFTNQIPAFNLARSVYAQRAYLDVLVRSTDAARKYVLLTTNTQDVLTFDLQDKIREDLLNLTVSPK